MGFDWYAPRSERCPHPALTLPPDAGRVLYTTKLPRLRVSSLVSPVGLDLPPVSPTGWILTLLLVAACVWVFAAVDRKSHSASDTLIGVFPHATLFIMTTCWIASHTAGPGNSL